VRSQADAIEQRRGLEPWPEGRWTVSRKRYQPDRSKTNRHEDYEIKYWTHHPGVSREQLQQAVDKVGNSAAAARKELEPYKVRDMPAILGAGSAKTVNRTRIASPHSDRSILWSISKIATATVQASS
jgi:hypothetical protein